MLEVFHDQKHNAPPQRRPNGRGVNGGTKKGNKKRSLRGHSDSLDEPLDSNDDDDEDE